MTKQKLTGLGWNTTKSKIVVLFLIAIIPRIAGLSEHAIFADEITWMARSKAVYAATRSQVWEYFKSGWWQHPKNAEPIGLPMAFLGGVSITFLSPNYSHYSLNLVKDFTAARIPNVIISSLFIPIFYLLLKKIISEKTAFITSLLLALDPISIGISRWLHQDAFLMTVSTLALLLYFRKNKFLPFLSAFFASLAILTKPQSFLIIIAIFLVNIKKIDKKFLIWFLAIGIFTFILFPFLWHNPIGGMFDYIKIQIQNVSDGHLTFFNGTATLSPPWYYYFAILPFRVPESVLIGILAFFLFVKKNIPKNNYTKSVIVYSILFLITISLSDKKLGIRYLYGIWPYIYLLAVIGLTHLEKFTKQKMLFWIIIFIFPILGVFKFYPSYYLFYNNLISPQNHQKLESVGFCDGVKPAIEYLEPKLWHGVSIMLPGCDSSINYYTGYTINRVESPQQKPDFIIEETQDLQKFPERESQIKSAGYRQLKVINLKGLKIATIYSR